MSDPDQTRITGEREYLQLVRREIRVLDRYAVRRLRGHRIARTVVITFGAAVPVLASWSAVSRVVLGLVGAVAAVAEAVAQLFQFQAAALNAMRTHNELEREINLFVMKAGPYAEQQVFARFVERIEDIRKNADLAFLETWQRPTPTQPPTTPIQPPQPSS